MSIAGTPADPTRGATMEHPTSQLDERFSDEAATATSWEQARAALETAQLSWISTVRVDGRPHVTPLVAVWHDGALHFSTGPDEQKAVNIAGNPHVVLMTGCNRWDEGLDVIVEGQARRVTERAVLQQLAAAWAEKWDGQWQFTPNDEGFGHEHGTALVFAVEPTKVLAFGKNPFSHTRHVPADA
jgi:general stress protein 26